MDIHDNFSKRKSSLLFEQWHREQCRSLDVMGQCWVVRDMGRLALA